MRQVSKKQQAKLRAYKKAKIARAEELKAEDKWVCIFTGHPIPDYLTGDKVKCHHALGRDGDLICDKDFLTFYIDERYHTGDEGYHNNSVFDKDFPEKSLCNKWWWCGFMSRMKEINKDLWYSLHLKSLGNLIEEAKRRGYRTGTLVDYEGQFTGTDTLGSGEFCVKDGKLIKYEKELKCGQNRLDRRFDTIWRESDGWTKIATEPHGFSF